MTTTATEANKPRQVEDRVLVDIPIDWLDPNPNNPRDSLGDLEALAELTDSVKSRGIVQPLVVHPNGDDRYTIVAGHRRHAAARNAGLLWVPCVVDDREATSTDTALDALVENLQRESLTPLEEARAYQHLRRLDDTITQKDIADRVGRSEAHISKRLSLLVLPDVAQTAVETGRLPVSTALGLTGLARHPERLAKLDKDLDAIADAETSDSDREFLRKRLEQSIARELQAVEIEAKTAELTAELTEMGIEVVPWPPGGYFAAKDKWRFCERGEHGEGTTIDPSGKPRDVTKAPTAKPSKPTGAAKKPTRGTDHAQRQLDLEASRAAEAERKATEVRRDAVIRRLVADAAKRSIPASFNDHALTQIVQLAIAEELYGAVELALDWLGIETTEDPSTNAWTRTRRALAGYAATDIKATRRTAFALSLAAIEDRVRDEAIDDWQDPAVQRHYAFLTAHGYEPSPAEAAHLAGSDE